jgi:hypothetical protein
MTRARYKFSPKKAFQAVHLMASRGAIDLHAALKACYFADKSHLNEHHQPIFGATYRAMKFGPVPLEIYELIKGESLWLWEVGFPSLPWDLRGKDIVFNGSNAPLETDEFSEIELEHLEAALEKSRGMSFTERTAATHGADWQKANGGIMHYEDMLNDTPQKPQIIAYMRETASRVRL